MRITERLVKTAKPGFYWDQDLKGFGLKVTPGGKRVLLVQKRPHKGAKTLKRWTLGAYPLLSLTEARTQAKTLLATLTLGTLHSATTDAPSVPFKDQIEKYYQEHVKAKCKPTTQKDQHYMIVKHLIPTFGNMTLAEVSPFVVRSFHTQLGSKHPYRANRVLALLSKFYSFYGESPNPTRGIQKFREKRREPTPVRMASLLDKHVHPAIRLLLLTGMRKSEVLSLRWESVSLDTHELRLLDSKTGGRTIYLSDPAVELLRALQQQFQPLADSWVFPAHRGLGHLIGLQKVWKRTLRNVGLPLDLRIHDLRHHYASLSARTLPLPIVAGLLGHKDIKTTMRYVHNHKDDLKAGATLVGKCLLNK